MANQAQGVHSAARLAASWVREKLEGEASTAEEKQEAAASTAEEKQEAAVSMAKPLAANGDLVSLAACLVRMVYQGLKEAAHLMGCSERQEAEEASRETQLVAHEDLVSLEDCLVMLQW